MAPTHWVSRQIEGDAPLINELCSWVEDSEAGVLYVYGGMEPAPKGALRSHKPTSDFYRCNLTDMRWDKLTDSLKFISDPSDRWGIGEEKRLPALKLPASSLVRMDGKRPLLILFGGFDLETHHVAPTNQLVVVDVERLEWCYAPIQSGPQGIQAKAVMGPVMVAVKNRLFIFGGFGRFGFNPLTSPSYKSYSILEYDSASWAWKWVACDVPLEQHVPSLGRQPHAVALYGGKQILLVPGHSSPDAFETITLSNEKLMFFNTAHGRCRVDGVTQGDFPRELSWLTVHVIPADGQPQPLAVAPTILFCGWKKKRQNEQYLVPETWRYAPTPEESIERVGIEDKVWDLQSNFQFAALHRGSLILFGSDIGEDDVEDGEYIGSTWNIYCKIPSN